jgi:hypothetical protein
MNETPPNVNVDFTDATVTLAAAQFSNTAWVTSIPQDISAALHRSTPKAE